MQPVQISAIALGNWNPKIFTPSWVKERLLDLNGKESIEVSLDFNDMDFSLKYNNILIIPKRAVFELRCESLEQSDVTLFTETIIRLFDLLPQTPVKAFGVNIIYKVSIEKAQKYLLLFQQKEIFEGFNATWVKYSKKNDNYIANIFLDVDSRDLLKINFNFHYPKLGRFDSGFVEKHIIESQKLL